MAFVLRSRSQILADMIATILAKSPINDINRGSVVRTLLEAAAQEAFQENYDMLQIIRSYNLDTTEGDDLVNRAIECGLIGRTPAQAASGLIDVSDSTIIKISSKIYSGLPGPVSGDTKIYVDDASSFPAAGPWSIIVGRGTDNVETVAVDTTQGSNGKTNQVSHWIIYLLVGLTNDHGSEETVILSQGGNRNIPAGTIVKIAESDISSEVTYTVNNQATIFDGEETAQGVLVTATDPGSNGNAPIGAVNAFASPPFNGVTVTNSAVFTNGADIETDEQLRGRIKDHIQSLSRGTVRSITSAIVGIVDPDENKRVVSANLIDAITLNDIATLYIDDGTGFEPLFTGQGSETLLNAATGGEQFLQLDYPPVVKAQVETINVEPYALGLASETLQYRVNGVDKTVTFVASDFAVSGIGTAEEVVAAINDRGTLVEARTSQSGAKVTLRAKALVNETIQVVGGTANASNLLNFPTTINETLKLYKFNGRTLSLLNKDGNTAYVESGNSQLYNITNGQTLTLVVDGRTANPQTVTFVTADFVTPGAVTALEVVTRLNKEMSGATAFVSSSGTKVTIRSNFENSVGSKIHITGGAANAALGFSTAEVVGNSKDYTLNRFNGQVELGTLALAGEQYAAGSDFTRGFVSSGNIQPFNLNNGCTITISIDSGGGQVITFLAGDFVNIGAALASEVVTVINRTLKGGLAIATSEGRVLIRTNNFSLAGSAAVTGVTGNATAFGFITTLTISSIQSHIGAVINGTPENYAFAEGDQLIVIVDEDIVNKAYTITMNVNGTIDNVVSPSLFDANVSITGDNFSSKFTVINGLVGFKIIIKTGASAGHQTTISAYNPAVGGGRITMTTPAPGGLVIGDTFTILPVSADNVVDYFNNNFVTTLGINAGTELIGLTKVQISSKTIGGSSSVQVTGGSANTKLGFSTTEVKGLDGYKYYIGLLRRVQRTVDGLPSDPVTFPGIKAAGVQVEVLPPTVKQVRFEINVTLQEGITLTSVQDDIKNAISKYVNSLGVGQDAILQEVASAVITIEGIADVQILSPLANVVIADNEVARIRTTDIVIG